MVEKKTDILGLCEVDEKNIAEIDELLKAAELNNFCIINLYNKEGNAIDDYCLIINTSKIQYTESKILAARGELQEKLKVGVMINAMLHDGTPIYIVLCHWQSRQTYNENTRSRHALGSALKESIRGVNGDNKGHVIICGDFNDEPFDKPIEESLCAIRDAKLVRKHPHLLYNPFWNCLGMRDHNAIPPGTCLHEGNQMTTSKTFDQIIFSSRFLTDEWQFVGVGVKIINDIPLQDGNSWKDLSDHYPVSAYLKRVIK